MDREQKAAVVEELAAEIEGSETIFAIDYRGISVPQAADLRSELRKADASFRIVKNRLTKLAAAKAGRDELNELLEGPSALTFVKGDTAMAAKTISTFHREHGVLTFKGGFMEGHTLDSEKFEAIAKLPSREVLDGQLAGVVASPLTGLVRGLGSMVSGLARQLQQIADQGLVSGEAPSPEAADAAEQDAGDPDTPGREAEEVSGSDSEAAADPDTPGSEAEDVSGSDSEDVAGSDPEISSDSNEEE